MFFESVSESAHSFPNVTARRMGLVIKEAMLINNDMGPLVNRDTGLDIPGCWHVCLKYQTAHAHCIILIFRIIFFLSKHRIYYCSYIKKHPKIMI